MDEKKLSQKKVYRSEKPIEKVEKKQCGKTAIKFERCYNARNDQIF